MPTSIPAGWPTSGVTFIPVPAVTAAELVGLVGDIDATDVDDIEELGS